MKRTIINGLITGLSATLLASCGGTSDSSSGSKLMATTAACYAAWNSTIAYNGGAQVSYNGVNYTAAYWTQNQNPSTNNGPAGSGQPWISNGACGSTTTPAPTPTPTPAPTPTPTPAPTPTPTPAPTPTPTPTPTPAPTPTSGVTLFQDCNYAGGWSATFGVGSYHLADLTARGVRNDDASSIRIPAGYKVTLYKDDNFTGTAVTLTGDNSCFVGINFNDAMSSMVVSSATPTPAPTPAPTPTTVVDLYVLYDAYSNNYFNGQVKTAMQSWVDQMNTINANSKVDFRWRLVGVEAHEEAGATMGDVLGNLHSDAWVAQRRAALGADFVSQIHQTGNCGVGYVAVDKNWAFNVVGPNCGPNAMAHELGHNMGLNHSRRQGDTSGTRYAYGLGYGVDNSFATIMAYTQSFGTAQRTPKYSNPTLTCFGVPCGVPEGQADQAYAAKALNNVKTEISGFFPTVVP